MSVLHTTTIESPIGLIGLVASSRGIRRASFGEAPRVASGLAESTGRDGDGEDAAARGHLAHAAGELAEFFARKRDRFDVPLDWSLSAGWALDVRRYLFESVGFGETISYGRLAASAGKPEGAQAVGGIMASNPIPVIIPCHRVIAADGGLGGFVGSRGAMVETKRRLLELEGSAAPTLF